MSKSWRSRTGIVAPFGRSGEGVLSDLIEVVVEVAAVAAAVVVPESSSVFRFHDSVCPSLDIPNLSESRLEPAVTVK